MYVRVCVLKVAGLPPSEGMADVWERPLLFDLESAASRSPNRLQTLYRNPDRAASTSAGVNQPKSAFRMHFAQIVGMSA